MFILSQDKGERYTAVSSRLRGALQSLSPAVYTHSVTLSVDEIIVKNRTAFYPYQRIAVRVTPKRTLAAEGL